MDTARFFRKPEALCGEPQRCSAVDDTGSPVVPSFASDDAGAAPHLAQSRMSGTDRGKEPEKNGSSGVDSDMPSGSPPPSSKAFVVNAKSRYVSWYATREGAFALARKEELLRRLISGWSRRTRSMLVMGAGQGVFLENLWESGFDVTGHEQQPELMEEARKRLGNRADFVLGAPDRLPFDDNFFDYAVAVDALEFWPDPEAVLREMRRVACCGVILMAPNAWSMFGLRCRAGRGQHGYGSIRPFLHSPRSMQRMLKNVFKQEKKEWLSALLAPVSTWRPYPVLEFANSLDIRLALGAVMGVRIDFGPMATGTSLTVRADAAVSAN